MTPQAFESLVTNIRSHLGCSEELAAEYAKDIGDTPEIESGQILNRNQDGRIIATFPASVLEEK
jgi:hypothetical protein